MTPAPPGGPDGPPAGGAGDGLPEPERFAPGPSEVRLRLDELADAVGMDVADVRELESFGLIAPGVAGLYDGDALAVAKAAAGLSRYGVQARHLRPYKAAADREVGLVRQIVLPLRRARERDGHLRAEEAARQIAALSVRLHAALVSAGLRRA